MGLVSMCGSRVWVFVSEMSEVAHVVLVLPFWVAVKFSVDRGGEEDLRPGMGMLAKLLGRKLGRLVEWEGFFGGRGGSVQGENRYLIQSFTSKKSTG